MTFAPRTLLSIGIAALAIGCGSTARPPAVDPFVGDWKLVPARSKVIDLMRVESAKTGTYAFDFGGGGETIAVDGTDQPGVSGTLLAVTAEAPDRWTIVRKQDGRVMIHAAWKLSPDGNTLTDDFTQFAPDGQVAVHGDFVYQRTAGGQGFAGTWERLLAMTDIPVSVAQIRPYLANGLSFIHPSQTRHFELDGKDHPLAGFGVAEGSTSAARWVDARTFEVTVKSHGKLEKLEQFVLSPDGKTLTHTTRPAGQREPNTVVFERQPANSSR